MKKQAHNILKIVGIVCCALALAYATVDWHHERKQAADERAFKLKFATISKDLKLGMSRDEVLRYAQDHALPMSFSGSSTGEEIDLELQAITSTQWYCSRWAGLATIRFADGRLREVVQTERGIDCL
jgi:hypothetical protein